MSKKQIETHLKELEKNGKRFESDAKMAIDVIEKDFAHKRDELKTKLNRQKTEEQEMIASFQKTNSQELETISVQMHAQNISDTDVGQRRTQSSDRIGLRLNQIYSETNNDMGVVVDKHKDRVRRMETTLAQNTLRDKPMPTMGPNVSPQEVTALKARHSLIIEEKNRRTTDLMRQLETVRKEINEKRRELADIDKSEMEQIRKKEEECHRNEMRERKGEMSRFQNNLEKLYNIKKN